MINSDRGPISHCFRHMASFPFQNAQLHIFLPLLFNPNFENVSLALDR